MTVGALVDASGSVAAAEKIAFFVVVYFAGGFFEVGRSCCYSSLVVVAVASAAGARKVAVATKVLGTGPRFVLGSYSFAFLWWITLGLVTVVQFVVAVLAVGLFERLAESSVGQSPAVRHRPLLTYCLTSCVKLSLSSLLRA